MSETPPPTQAPRTDFESQYERIFAVTECRTQVELAEILDIRQSSISDAKRRKALPSDWLMKLYEKRRVNPEWIRTGIGPQIIIISENEDGKVPAVIHVIEYRPAHDCSTDELLTELIRRTLKIIG